MEKYIEWFKVSTELSDLKKREADLRRTICAEMLNGSTGREFSVKKIIGSLKIVATQKINISIDEAVLGNIYHDLTIEERSAIKFKPSIIKFVYKNLSIGLLHQSIVESPATPTLKMEEI